MNKHSSYGELYTRKGKKYYFLHKGKMKHPDTGDWLDSVTYYDEVGTYTCTLKRWNEEFTEV